MVLRPGDVTAYMMIESLYAFTRDKQALANLSKGVETAALDVEEVNRVMREDFQGKNDDKLRKELAGTGRKRDETLAAGRKVGGATFALAASAWIGHQFAADKLGQPVKADALVALADEAHKAAPSYGTRSLRTSTRLFRAHDNLKKQEPAYAALAEKGQRSLGPDYVIAIALGGDGPARKACLANTDVQGIIAKLKEEAGKSLEDAT